MESVGKNNIFFVYFVNWKSEYDDFGLKSCTKNDE